MRAEVSLCLQVQTRSSTSHATAAQTPPVVASSLPAVPIPEVRSLVHILAVVHNQQPAQSTLCPQTMVVTPPNISHTHSSISISSKSLSMPFQELPRIPCGQETILNTSSMCPAQLIYQYHSTSAILLQIPRLAVARISSLAPLASIRGSRRFA